MRLGAGIRSLDSNHGKVIAYRHRQIEVCRLFLDPDQILFSGSGINDHAIEIVVQEIHNQIVDYAALFVEHAGIQRLALLLEASNIVG